MPFDLIMHAEGSKRNEEGSFAGRNKVGDEKVSGLPSWCLSSKSDGATSKVDGCKAKEMKREVSQVETKCGATRK